MSNATYRGDYPIPKEWAEQNRGQSAQFHYWMSLAQLIDTCGVDEMNDYLDAVLGDELVLTDISYEIAGTSGADEVLVRAQGVIEEI